jgi:hypothetical protein
MADFYIDNNSNDLTKYKTRLLEIIEMIWGKKYGH